MKNINLLCLGCAKEKPNEGTCPYCKFDLDKYQARAHHLKPEKILNGKYLVGKALGEGRFGITYIGWDLNLDFPVVIKEYFPSGIVTRDANYTDAVSVSIGDREEYFKKEGERVLSEARILAKFEKASGIVSVKDFFSENGTVYMIMEYIEGEDFNHFLRRNGEKLSADTVFEMVKPVMEALIEVHSKGLIHRDISPDNIMIAQDSTMKLLNFGAIREMSAEEKSFSVMLKPGYYVPEEQYRMRGKQGSWTDIYALCATIYRAITGVKPMGLERIRDDKLKTPSELGISINPKKEKALMKGMELLGKNRWQNVKELYDVLYLEERKPENVKAKQKEPQNPAMNQGNGSYMAVDAAKNQGKQNKKMYAVIAAIAAIAVVCIAFAIGISNGESPKTFENSSVISAGVQHTVGLREDGTVVAAGSNDAGQCEVSDWEDIVAISAGWYHTAGLKEDGTVVAVGNNEYGQCEVSDWKDIVAISAGWWHTVGLKEDGTVVAVGLGFNDYDSCEVDDWKDIVAISAGGNHTVGLREDGTVVAVGYNEYGECKVSDWKDIMAISAGICYTVGLREDGTVVAVGENEDGQCEVSDWEDIVAISAGGLNTVGLKEDGTVVAVGCNNDGEYEVSGWEDIVAISAGWYYAVGLKRDGTVVAVGENEDGQCEASNWKDIKILSKE